MNDTTDATAIFAPLWRRKWLILVVGILVAGATYVYYKHHAPVYSAKTQVYLGSASEQQLLNNNFGKTNLSNTEISNQAALINSTIGEVVRRELRKKHKLAEARGKAKAKSSNGSDFIQITAEAHTARAAAQLANDYAQTYVKQHQGSYERAVRAALANTRRQLQRAEANQEAVVNAAKGKGSSASKGSGLATAALQNATLSSKINQLESDLSLSSVQQIGPAKPGASVLVSTSPKKNAIFGFVIGIALAAAAAYALSRFDRRLRSLADIEAIFQAQILAVLPTVRRPIVHRDGQPAPARSLREPLRRFHTMLQLGDMVAHHRGDSPRSILFVSADAGDGKSTLIANLALVQRDAGERAAVIEADLRRGVQARLLDVDGSHGLAEVLAGTIGVEDAMQSVESMLPEASANSAGPPAGVATVAGSRSTGPLSVLVSGGAVANPPALLASGTMTDLLRSITDDFDHVLVDVPPPLEVSDAMPLLARVDAIVIVARLGHTHETSAQRLVELLARTASAPVLGIVANDASRAQIETYGFSSASNRQRLRRNFIGR